MMKYIQDFVSDMVQTILNIDIQFLENLSDYYIFHNQLFHFLSMQKFLKDMELSNKFHYGSYYCIHTSLKIYFTIVPVGQADDKINEYLVIGPYLAENFTDQVFGQLCKKYRISASNTAVFRALYTTFPSISEKQIETVASSVMKYLLNIENPKKVRKEFLLSTPLFDKILPTESFHITSDILEKRYQSENLLLAAIYKGNAEEAVKMMSSWKTVTILPKPKNEIRGLKNLSIITNTLYRKTVEFKNVHPYYLDQVSRKYAILIEKAETSQQLDTIHINMIYEYCKLVNQFSLSQYSLIIRKTIDYITLNLSEDLSLASIAQKIELAPAYLSSQFKKEVNVTVTDFIHQKRCEKAAALLAGTDLSVIDIAEQAGIPDSSYFTYLFKRYYKMTPTQYRKKYKEANPFSSSKNEFVAARYPQTP